MINYDYYLTTMAEFMEKRKNEFTLEYDKARNKNTVVAKWIDELRVESNSIQRELVQIGLGNFKREWENTYELDSGIDEGQAFDQTVANCFPDFNIEQIDLISKIDALSELVKFIESNRIINSGDGEEDPLNNNTPIWIGKNETEFMQLIEGLIETKRLDPKVVGGKWKLIELFAKFVGIQLSKNANSNLSKSKNERNNDYCPKIFEELLKVWNKKSN